jgi:phosphatidylinositol phospholipase C, delta
VAKAVADCAFETSVLPVILSLEMHCSSKQQRMLAEMMLHHIGTALISVRTVPPYPPLHLHAFLCGLDR